MSKIARKLNKNINRKKSKSIKIKLKKPTGTSAKRKAKTHKAAKKNSGKRINYHRRATRADF